MRCHDGSQVVALYEQLVLVLAALLVDVDDGSGHLRYPLNHHLPGEGRRSFSLWASTYISQSIGIDLYRSVNATKWSVKCCVRYIRRVKATRPTHTVSQSLHFKV